VVKGTSSTASRHFLFAERWRASGSAVRCRRPGGNSEIAARVSQPKGRLTSHVRVRGLTGLGHSRPSRMGMSGHGDPRCPSRHPHLSTIASWRYWKVNGGATIGEIRFRSFTGARSSSSHLPRNRRSTRRANVASNDAQGCTVRGHALIRLVSAECSSDFDFRSQDIGGEVGRLAAGRVRGNAAHRAGKKVRAKDPLSTREGKPPRIQAMNEGTGKRRSALDGAGRSSELPAGLTGAGKPVSTRRSDEPRRERVARGVPQRGSPKLGRRRPARSHLPTGACSRKKTPRRYRGCTCRRRLQAS